MAKSVQVATNVISFEGVSEESLFVLLDDGRIFYKAIICGHHDGPWDEIQKGPWD